MVALVIDLVNAALRRVGREVVTVEELDSGNEKHHVVLREALQEIWEELAILKPDDFKVTFQLNLSPEQNEYVLGFHPSQLANLNLWLDGELLLNYKSEGQARREYPDFSRIPVGKPQAWFLASTATPGEVHLKFIPQPGAEYVVSGLRQLWAEPLSAASYTTCNQLGDRCIRTYLQWILQLEEGFTAAPRFEERFQAALNEYVATSSPKNRLNTFQFPYQNR